MKTQTIIAKLLFMVAVALSIASCSKEEDQLTVNEDSSDVFISAQKEFAKILSSALYEEPDLRAFLKNEALKEFDMDYDVFYPYTKDEVISGDRTFKDILISHSEDPSSLDRIEAVIPKLTILVPDWSWIDKDGFSVNTWDTSSKEVFVGISDDSSDHVIFLNGKEAGTVSAGTIPCSPVVIIKSNERMRVVSPATRGSEATFDFVYDVYDGRNKQPETRTHDTNIYWNYDKSGESDFVPASALPSIVKEAAEEFKYYNNKTAQRDYIYYGMSKSNTNAGVLDHTIKEYIYRFKINPSKITILDYQNSSDAKTDPHFESTSPVFKKQKNKLSPESNGIQEYLWSEGSLEIKFVFYLGTYGSNVLSSYSVPQTVKPSELWEVKKSVEKRRTCFSVFHYTYISDKADLVAKWFYPKDFPVEPFDLANNSTAIWFSVYEEDPSGTIEKTITTSCKYTTNVKRSGSLSGNVGNKGEKWSFGVQFSISGEDASTTENGCLSSFTFKINEGSDFLGDGTLNYTAPIINSGKYTKGGVEGYNLKSIPTSGGDAEITFVPKHNW